MVKRAKEEPSRTFKKRDLRGGGKPKAAFAFSIQDVLCDLCG